MLEYSIHALQDVVSSNVTHGRGGAGFNGGTALVVCCGAGGRYNYNATAACGVPGATACADPSSALNWDGIHLTDKAYADIAAAWLRGPYAKPTILDLAH